MWYQIAMANRLGSPPRTALSEELLVALRRSRDLVDRDYWRSLPVTRLAAASGLSPFAYIRAFAAAYGETPGRYRTRRRMERARELLRATSLPVTEVALAVGFASLGTFCRRFAESVGESPSAYRRQARRPGATAAIPGCFVLTWQSGLAEAPPREAAIPEKRRDRVAPYGPRPGQPTVGGESR